MDCGIFRDQAHAHGVRFPRPKIFTSALVGHHEITTLIRDTEPHERALFTIDPSTVQPALIRHSVRHAAGRHAAASRKGTFGNAGPKQHSAVARVLGGNMLQEIRRTNDGTGLDKNGDTHIVDIEILLQGAEKLCAV